MLYDENNKPTQEVIAHAPSLGCCGYADKEQYVYVVPHEKPKTCSHVIHLAHREEKEQKYLIGIHPKSAEKIVNICLENSYIKNLQNLKEIKAEQCFLNSRFDFCGIDENNKKFILEVKMYLVRIMKIFSQKKERKEIMMLGRMIQKLHIQMVTEKNTDIVSPRALKHIQELEQLKQENKELRQLLYL